MFLKNNSIFLGAYASLIDQFILCLHLIQEEVYALSPNKSKIPPSYLLSEPKPYAHCLKIITMVNRLSFIWFYPFTWTVKLLIFLFNVVLVYLNFFSFCYNDMVLFYTICSWYEDVCCTVIIVYSIELRRRNWSQISSSLLMWFLVAIIIAVCALLEYSGM